MIVVDASCLYEAITGTINGEAVRERLLADPDQVAPHVVDVEVMNLVRRNLITGYLDATEADQAIDDLLQWP
ncbi:MAG: VapC toxin family PIN domain ribonuclease, partial [Acidimicrobiales bacterium]|nr:VapC toxin family PIN domain ribonuclease [Acidimicrobiales bacterium]